MVIAASFALLVPDNQQGLRAAESFRALPDVAYTAMSLPVATSSASESVGTSAPRGEITWVLALGFLVAIVSRRLGSEA
jgi:hypothetical protein